MPGWTAPDDIGSILQDIQSRLRRLETYNPLPLVNGQVLMSQVLNYVSAGVFSLPNTTTAAAAWGAPFNLLSKASVIVFATGSMVSNTGAAPNSNYQIAGLRIDGSPGVGVSADVQTTVGSGLNPYTLVAVGQSLAAGVHGATVDYLFDVAGNTSASHYNLFMHAFIIGG